MTLNRAPRNIINLSEVKAWMNLMENLEYKVMCTTFEEGIFLKRQPNSGTAKQLEYL